jgi:putative hydrolase of HD superfamily
MENFDQKKIANFLFEVGTMRKLPRMHRQTLLTDDMSDNIATHSYRVAIIAWFLSKMEETDPYKTLMMALFHDMAEVRTGDHNWIHKRYVREYEDDVRDEQLGSLPFPEIKELADEYEKRESEEAIVAKDAALLDKVLLLREYEWQGNKEASVWLHGKKNEELGRKAGAGNRQLERLQTDSAKKLGKDIYETPPSDWWNNLWTDENK